MIKKLLEATEYKNFKISNENNISLDIFLHNNYENIIIPNNYFTCICNSINKDFLYENNLKYDSYKNQYYTLPITSNIINKYKSLLENNEIYIDKNILNIELLKEGIINFFTKNNSNSLLNNNENLYQKWEKGIDLYDIIDNSSEFINLITNGISNISPAFMAMKISGADDNLSTFIKNIPIMPKYYIPKIIQWAIKNRRNNNNMKSTIANKILNCAISIKKKNKLAA